MKSLLVTDKRVHLSRRSVHMTLSVLEAVRSRVHDIICAGGCMEPCTRISLYGRLNFAAVYNEHLYGRLFEPRTSV